MESHGILSKGSSESARVSPPNEPKPNDVTGSIIGPVLPPGFIDAKHSDEEVRLDQSGSSSDSESQSEQSLEEPGSPPSTYGPALPPGFAKIPPERPVIGAALPPGMTKESLRSCVGDDDSSSSESHELIGPLPPTSGHQFGNDAVQDFERRALKMKQRLTSGPDEELKREEWMTVLPPELGKNFGFGPRSFLRKTPRAAGDRSVWTDTPSQRVEKELSGDAEEKPSGSNNDELQDVIQQNYDEKMSKKAKELNKTGKRAKSLMEIHQKNLKRKKKEDESKPKERIPFDRDTDLKVNMIDDAKRKALVKQSAQLNDKFSPGKGQFL